MSHKQLKKEFGNETLKAAFHAWSLSVVALKISPFLKGRTKTSPYNRVTKNSSRKEKYMHTEKKHPESTLQTSAQLVCYTAVISVVTQRSSH